MNDDGAGRHGPRALLRFGTHGDMGLDFRITIGFGDVIKQDIKIVDRVNFPVGSSFNPLISGGVLKTGLP